ncbi:hypothetical protein QT711_11170 [Sporosarcina saromensis]|uniref:DNA-binding protein n=1 Tax=Sporosarcina saromensis TaxID=359365 RepID=A0ABU4G9V8_9BACL|nr:hypothetical protein [Sporosarcina saromensis]MDW0113748.1 hypothetical protein [Sporosarcina saromensis]
MEKLNVFEQIMDVHEASDLWGLSVPRLKAICQEGLVDAKKFGNSWVILKDQPNPKQRERKK